MNSVLSFIKDKYRRFSQIPVIAAVRMQLKERNSRSQFLSSKPAFFRYIFELLKLVLITGAFFLVMFLLVQFSIISPVSRVPISFVSFAFSICIFLMIIISSVSLSKKLYFEQDNKLLFTFPLTHFQVFLSKMITFYIEDLKRNMLYYFPLFISVGIINVLSPGYYFWMILMFFFVSLISFASATILSLVFTLIGKLFQKFKYTGIVTIILILAVFVLLLFFTIRNLPENFNLIGRQGYYFGLIRNFLSSYNNTMLPFRFSVELIVGPSMGSTSVFAVTGKMMAIFGVFILSVSVFLVGGFFLQRFFFYRVATNEDKTRTTKVKNRKNKTHGAFVSSLRNEWLAYGRSPSLFVSRYLLLLFVPFLIILLALFISGMNVRYFGIQLTIAFAILILLLSLLVTNLYTSSILSVDGKASYHLKTSPTDPKKTIYARLLTHLIIHFFIAAGSILALNIIFPEISFYIWLIVFVSVILLDVGHILYSVGLDLSNPQHTRYINGACVGVNPNETLCLVMGVAVSLIYAGFQIFSLFMISFGTAGGVYWRELIVCGMYFVFYII